MNENIINEVSNDMGIKSTQVESVLKLLSEGNTIPFIARYRKEATGALDEEQIRKINEYYEYEEYLGKNENILSFVSDELKNDKDVILAMIKNDSFAYFTIPQKFKYDMDIIKIVLDSDSCLNTDILEEVKDDKKLLEKIEKYNITNM